MEENYDPGTVSFKRYDLKQLVIDKIKSQRLRKLALLAKRAFFPWIIIKNLKHLVQVMNNEITKRDNQISELTAQHIHLSTQNSNLSENVSELVEKVSYLTQQLDILMTQNAGQISIQTLKYVNEQNNHSHIQISPSQIAGALHWPELLNKIQYSNGFRELIRLLTLVSADGSQMNALSNCWMLLSSKNCDQLLEHGYKNFKRTIGHNYFNFLINEGDPQIKAVEQLLLDHQIKRCARLAGGVPHDPENIIHDQYGYYYFIFLLWEYCKVLDKNNYLDQLEEPAEGNPLLVHAEGKSMSQDLANSIIEYYSIIEGVPMKNINTLLEIGGGYGRNAHVILSLNPDIRIVLVDIMPALYIAQRYLSSVFKNHKVFRVTNFSSYEEVKNEIDSSRIVFLLPNQLTLLPDLYFDLSMNISSFGEMNIEQIQWYFKQINRLTRDYFYMKQWNISKNPFDDLELKKNDYPYPTHWEKIYSRSCAIQTDFFETLFRVTDQ